MAKQQPLTLGQRFTFTLNYIKNFTFIIVPLTAFLGYVTVLVVKDTVWYKKIDEIVQWYEEKAHSFAVGLRVNKVADDNGTIEYEIVYKAVDGKTYPAFEQSGVYYYTDSKGKYKECH